MERKKGAPAEQKRLWIHLLCLALCFVIGAAVGQLLSAGTTDATGMELRQSLVSYYRRREGTEVTPSVVCATILAWFRYPALALLLGFTSLGAPLLCVTAAVFGFSLSFSVGCFAAAFGREGILLTLAALGVRAFVTLPCYFLLALPAMERAASLFRLSMGRGTYADIRPDRRVWLARLALCALILSAGVCADLLCTPRLLRLALAWVLDGLPPSLPGG